MRNGRVTKHGTFIPPSDSDARTRAATAHTSADSFRPPFQRDDFSIAPRSHFARLGIFSAPRRVDASASDACRAERGTSAIDVNRQLHEESLNLRRVLLAIALPCALACFQAAAGLTEHPGGSEQRDPAGAIPGEGNAPGAGNNGDVAGPGVDANASPLAECPSPELALATLGAVAVPMVARLTTLRRSRTPVSVRPSHGFRT